MENYNRKELADLLASGQTQALDDMSKIEDVISLIRELEHKVDIQKVYKKSRVEAIDNEIEKLSTKVAFFKKVVIATLDKIKEKSFTFPEVARITAKKPGEKWVIDDAEELIKVLEKENEKDNVGSVETTYNIDSKKVKELFKTWEKLEKIPSCVHKEVGEKSLSITYLGKDIEDESEINSSEITETEKYDEIL